MSEINNIKASIQSDVSIAREAAKTGSSQRAAGGALGGLSTNTEADKVSLSDTLSALKQRLADMPIVDQSRVDTVKAKIESGSYTMESNELARKMISFEGGF